MASYLGPWAFRALFTAFKKFYDNTTKMRTLSGKCSSPLLLSCHLHKSFLHVTCVLYLST